MTSAFQILKSSGPRVFSALCVLVWAAVILYFYDSGRIVKYLSPDFRWIALAGGLGLAVLGAFNMLHAFREVPYGHEAEIEPTSFFGILFLFPLPLLLASIWTKDAFSEATLSRKGLYDHPQVTDLPFLAVNLAAPTREEIEQSHTRTEEGYLQFPLMELFFAAGDREMQAVLQDLKVETEGRFVEEKIDNPDGKRMRLYRLFMLCCIADARVIPIVLEFEGKPPQLPSNAWVKVAGKMRFPQENGQCKVVLDVEKITVSEAPAEEKFLIR